MRSVVEGCYGEAVQSLVRDRDGERLKGATQRMPDGLRLAAMIDDLEALAGSSTTLRPKLELQPA